MEPVSPTNEANIDGHQNIVIQNVTNSQITVSVGGELKEIKNQLDELKKFIVGLATPITNLQVADNQYQIDGINEANFGYIMGQAGGEAKLPNALQGDLADRDRWVESLRQELLGLNIAVGNKRKEVIQHYGWMIEASLQKMLTEVGKANTLRRLSFMVEAYQSSLRYLCYIQLAQLAKGHALSPHPSLTTHLQMRERDYLTFDYANLLIVSTDLLTKTKQVPFVPEINVLVKELASPTTDLYQTSLFLATHRTRLLKESIAEDDQLPEFLDEYLTALVYWLRQLAFLAKYRLWSIKEINLNYRAGLAKKFVHTYGELHGIYDERHSLYREIETEEEDYKQLILSDNYTFNHSVLLVPPEGITDATAPSALSLSPFLIDQSVFSDKPTQTPEAYYFTGYHKSEYHFALYKNEILPESDSNKSLKVKKQNNQQPKYNYLFEQLETVCRPLRNPA
jgi:hypothetical protein